MTAHQTRKANEVSLCKCGEYRHSYAISALPVTDSELINATGLVDSGASMNVLPYDVGVSLGAVWEQQPVSLALTGNFSNFEAKALKFNILIPQVSDEPVMQAFAWSRGNISPIILGQVNFLMSFNIGFYRSQAYFEISSRTY